MRKLQFFTTVTLFFGIVSLSWNYALKDDLKTKVDAFLKSSVEVPDSKLVLELRKGKEKNLNWLKTTYWKGPLDYTSYKQQKKFLKLYDKVSGQKDAIASELFWYNTTEEALAEAKKLNRPVLSLQMLGDLSDDFSCANSRFFRTLLYSDPKISQILRENFILCHESVINVPKVIIEYPDGQKQIQTITGNSMHLLLDKDGKILDALPGLYGPEYFRKWLQQFSDPLAMANIKDVQKQKLETLKDPLLKEALEKEEWNDLVDENSLPAGSPVAALKASEISAAKVALERPLYNSLKGAEKTGIKKSPRVNIQTFPGYAAYGFVWETVSKETINLIASKKHYSEEELKSTISDLSDNLSKESVRNDVKLHATILQWLNDKSDISKKEFVENVYSKLFLTPLNDAKMGLYDRSIFSGLTEDGFIED